MDTAAIKLFFERFDKDFILKTRRKKHITADFKFSEMTDAELERAARATRGDGFSRQVPRLSGIVEGVTARAVREGGTGVPDGLPWWLRNPLRV